MGLPIASELVSVFLSNPLFAWFLIFFILLGDSFIGGIGFLNGLGIIGFIMTFVLNSFGVYISISSFHILVISAFLPIIIYSLRHSAKH